MVAYLRRAYFCGGYLYAELRRSWRLARGNPDDTPNGVFENR
jgi:hypothetical protein